MLEPTEELTTVDHQTHLQDVSERTEGLPFDELVRLHQRALIDHARRLCGDHALAEDVVQEVFLKVWHRQLDLQGPGARAYLRTMVRNRLIDRSRTRAFRLELVQPDMSTVGATAGGHSVLERVVVTDLVRRLSDKDRQVLIEVYLRDRSVEQTAEVLGLPSGTVRSRCFYALRRLRSMLDDEPELLLAG
ncbi:RNA polymerase sigma factor [Angustibacter aerolatus]